MTDIDISKTANFLIQKFSNKDNFKKIDDLNSKLSYYDLLFDNYQHLFSQNFIFVNDINILFDSITNIFMIYVDDLNNKKIIFDTPHYRIINFNFPSSEWKILKLR